jgi:hypothetical protein
MTHSCAAVDASIVACFLRQLCLERLQVAEQDASLSVAHVGAGQGLEMLRMVATVTDGDMHAQFAWMRADRLK